MILIQLLVIIGAVMASDYCFKAAWSSADRSKFTLWHLAAFIVPMVVYPMAGMSGGYVVPLFLLAFTFSEKLWEGR